MFVDNKPYCVTKDVVYMMNEEAFIVSEAISDFSLDEYRRPLYFDNEGIIGHITSWHFTLKSVKEAIKVYEKYQYQEYNNIVKCKMNKVNDEQYIIEIQCKKLSRRYK